jgi:hypothetical protein
MRRVILCFVILVLGVLAWLGCDRAPDVKSSDAAASALPSGLIATTAPAGAKDILALKRTAKDGDAVVLRGRIGGRKDPIGENRAIITLIDMSLEPCNKKPEDRCATPWDACCQTPETITANSATVEVVDGNGQLVKASLGGKGGIAPMKQILVTGKVAGPVDQKNLLVRASSIYVVD